MGKISKQIFKGHTTYIMSILMSFFSFFFKLQFLCLLFLLFSLFNFDFTTYFYVLVLYSVFEKHKLGRSTIDQIEATVLTTKFLTVAKRITCLLFIIEISSHFRVQQLAYVMYVHKPTFIGTRFPTGRGAHRGT